MVLEKKYASKEIMAGLIMKLVSVAASIYGLIRTMDSLLSFTYFTNLSNIFLDLVLLLFIYFDIELLLSKGKRDRRSNPAYITKYVATISITLTFFVFLTLLAPTNVNGFAYAYLNNGAGSLCVHMIGPVLAIIDFLLFDYGYASSKKHALFATIPPLVYVVFVIILSSRGVRWETKYAPYNFLNFGAPTGWFGFDLSLLGSDTLGIGVFYMIVVLLAIFCGIGLFFLWLKDRRRLCAMADRNNPWQNISLSDYENHMALDSVRQLQAMNRMMKGQLNQYDIRSAMILGIAGGNGLEHVDPAKLDKVYGVDINQEYLKITEQRYANLSDTLECLCVDLTSEAEKLPQVDMLIANLLIEYIGYECFKKVVAVTNPSYVSCIIQINVDDGFVSDSPYLHAFDGLEQVHHQMAEQELQSSMDEIGYQFIQQLECQLPNGKKLVQLDFCKE